ncbi:MAG TPA: phytanoyl-CoA dioxygenase family protein [Xanthobacteraceae bacterium]|nr:phytanoyl-CoA dioxygenase family protein [Xanthobacteraceae bacterium]
MLTEKLLPGVPLVESPFFERDAPKILPPDYLRVARDLNEKGFAIFDFPDPDLEAKMEGIKRDYHDRYDWRAWRGGKLNSLRIQDAWKSDPRVREIATNSAVLDMISAIYAREAFAFQTLNFAVGTQQEAHSDHAHFNSIPDRFMCGVWLAFEDVDSENGPLFYYPGSHRWPSYQNEHLGVSYRQINGHFPEYRRYVRLWNELAAEQGIQREIFRARKGQALLWSSNILHGGSAQVDPSRTRWSQVTHYFFKGCAYTTPVANDTFQGRVHYRDVTDVQTGQLVPNVISGEPLDPQFHTAIQAQFAAPAAAPSHLRDLMRTLAVSPFRENQELPPGFDPLGYLALNADLLDAGTDPFEHFLAFGRNEGRSWSL